MKNKKNDLILDVHEKPELYAWFFLAMQHVFAMFGATVMVPILVNGAAGFEVMTIPVTLISSGIGTLAYILCTKGKSPVYLGSSFAYITPMALGAVKAGIAGAYTAVIIVGLIYLLIALIIKCVGKDWINKVLPPIVVGPMIMVIGFSLAPSAIGQIGLDGNSVFSVNNLIVAVVTFMTTILVALLGKGFAKVVPFLIGIISGYVVSCVLGMVDFTLIFEAPWFQMPTFIIPFVSYVPNFNAVATIAPVALVSIAEHVGDHMALGKIINKNLVEDPGLDRTLAGDGVASVVAGMIGGPANTTYGENTAVVGISKVASVYVIGLAAVITIIFAFFGKLTALFETVPSPVLGGVAIFLYGFISVNGLKVLIQSDTDFDDIRNVIIASTMLIIGLGGATLSIASANFSMTIGGMSLAALFGVLLNIVLPRPQKV